MTRRHALGEILNEAVRIKPSSIATEPKAGHITFAEMFWESLSHKDTQNVVSELNQIMNYLLTQSKREAKLERAVWFMSFAFGRLLDASDASQRSAANSFINTLCDRSSCENKTVRLRCCQSIRLALEVLPMQPEIDEAMAETIYATLLARIRDRSYEIRTQALLALDRFKICGTDGAYLNDQVTATYLNSLEADPHPTPRAAILDCLPVTSVSVEAICRRTADVSEVVRIHAFKAISMKLSPEILEKKWCGEAMKHGLNDRSDLVKPLAEKTLVTWLDETAQGDPYALFQLFDWEAHVEIYPVAMEALLSRRLDVMEAWSEKSRFSMTGLDTEQALFWKTLLCGCKRRAEALGKSAATDPEKAAETQTLFDLIDRFLPAALVEFVTPFVALLEEPGIQSCQFLLEILTQCFNFTDEGDQRIAAELFQRLCRLEKPEMNAEWYRAVMAFGRVVLPDADLFVQSALSAPLNLQSSHGVPHQLVMAVEMLRALPLRLHNAYALGTPLCTVADLLMQFKEALMGSDVDPQRQKWLIEGIGICLAFKMSHEEHESCLPLIWRALESSEAETAAAVVDTLTTLAMTHGVRRVDQKSNLTGAAAPSQPLWECRVFDGASGSPSLPIQFMNRLHWEQSSAPEIQTALVQSLCKLLIINHAFHQTGMHLGESIQCLCPLVVLFVYEEEDEKQNERLQQLLRVFFDRYAQAHVSHQYLFRAGFIPFLRYCLELTTALRLSITPATKFLANLLLAPLHDKILSELDRTARQRELAQWNAQLVCLLLWEIQQCPLELTSAKSYVSALWKVILDLKLENCEEAEKLQILALMEEPSLKESSTTKQLSTLKSKLELHEGLTPYNGEALVQLKAGLDDYMSQLGTHPFSDEED